MSFFSYKPQEEKPGVPPSQSEKEMNIPPHMIIIDGTNLVKLIEDNPELPEGPTDIGNGQFGVWRPCNYNPETMEIIK